jgi:hypothetical protein
LERTEVVHMDREPPDLVIAHHLGIAADTPPRNPPERVVGVGDGASW